MLGRNRASNPRLLRFDPEISRHRERIRDDLDFNLLKAPLVEYSAQIPRGKPKCLKSI